MSFEPKSNRAKERYDKILDVSLELFLENGYENTSLNMIIEKSGGSLSTIYKYFENKDGLFKAIMKNGVKIFSKEINERICISTKLTPEEYLRKFSSVYIDILLDRRCLLFNKVVLSEKFRNDSNIAKIYYEYGISKINKILEEYMKSNYEFFKLKDDELHRFASYFCMLLKNPYYFDAIFFNNSIENLREKEKEEHIDLVVSFFLNGILHRNK